MSCLKVTGKRAFSALFSLLVLTSCAKNQREWKFESNEGVHEHFCSSRLYLPPENAFVGLEVDILSTSQGHCLYINTFGVELQPEEQNPEGFPIVTVKIKVVDQEQCQNFIGFLLQGGHRILLEEKANEMLIQALHEHKTVEISVAHYSAVIIPDNFAKHYEKL